MDPPSHIYAKIESTSTSSACKHLKVSEGAVRTTWLSALKSVKQLLIDTGER